MAFSIFRLGRSSVSVAFERGALSGVATASLAMPEAPNKGVWRSGPVVHSQRAYGMLASSSGFGSRLLNLRSYPVGVSERCTGDSCPIDITRLRRNSSSSTISERSLSTSAPASFTNIVRRYSKTSDTEGSDKDKNKKGKKKLDINTDSDSDSDTEIVKNRKRAMRAARQPGERGEFWRRKMRTFHAIIDVNKDGVIAYDDFQLLAKRFIDLGNLDPTQAGELQEIVQLTWEEQWGEISPYNLVTVEMYLTDMEHVLKDRELKAKAGKFLPYLFKAVDKDNSGFISVNEFKLFFRCLGLSEDNAAVAFAIIDLNGDGVLSLKEFCKLGKEFFFTEDEEKPSKMFWGPLMP